MASRVRTVVGALPDENLAVPGHRRCVVRTQSARGASPEQLERALAEAALQLWPEWPDAPKDKEWLGQAAALAGAGHLPLPDTRRPGDSVLGLRQVLGPIQLDIASELLDEASADGMSRTLEWLQRLVDDFEIRWFVPEAAARFPGVVRMGPEPPDEKGTPFAAGAEGRSTESSARPSPSSEASRGSWSVRLDPIIGRPHPASPGEIMLHAALQASELADRFSPNQLVDTTPGEAFIVDFVDVQSPLVVEVDGFRFHSGVKAFARDRHRDFCLLASGRRVLRLTHDEVVASPEKAVDKIRAVLRASQTRFSP